MIMDSVDMDCSESDKDIKVCSFDVNSAMDQPIDVDLFFTGVFKKEKEEEEIVEEMHNQRVPIVYSMRLDDMYTFTQDINTLTMEDASEFIITESKPPFKTLEKINPVLTVNQRNFEKIQKKISKLNKNSIRRRRVIQNCLNRLCVPVGHMLDTKYIVNNEQTIMKCKRISIVLTDIKEIVKMKRSIYSYNGNRVKVPTKKVKQILKLKSKRPQPQSKGYWYINIYIIIKDEYSKQISAYEIDENSNISASYKCDFRNTSVLNAVKFDDGFIMENCCWYKRKENMKNITNILPSVYRFIQTRHTCLLNNCICCCNKINKKVKPTNYSSQSSSNQFVEETDDDCLIKALENTISCQIKNIKEHEKQNTLLDKSKTVNFDLTSPVPKQSQNTWLRGLLEKVSEPPSIKCVNVDKLLTVTKVKGLPRLESTLIIFTDITSKEVEFYELDSGRELRAYYKLSSITGGILSVKNKLHVINKTVCCWQSRDSYIAHLVSINSMYSTTRAFMRRPHSCPLGNCSCCCSKLSNSQNKKPALQLAHISLPRRSGHTKGFTRKIRVIRKKSSISTIASPITPLILVPNHSSFTPFYAQPLCVAPYGIFSHTSINPQVPEILNQISQTVIQDEKNDSKNLATNDSQTKDITNKKYEKFAVFTHSKHVRTTVKAPINKPGYPTLLLSPLISKNETEESFSPTPKKLDIDVVSDDTIEFKVNDLTSFVVDQDLKNKEKGNLGVKPTPPLVTVTELVANFKKNAQNLITNLDLASGSNSNNLIKTELPESSSPPHEKIPDYPINDFTEIIKKSPSILNNKNIFSSFTKIYIDKNVHYQKSFDFFTLEAAKSDANFTPLIREVYSLQHKNTNLEVTKPKTNIRLNKASKTKNKRAILNTEDSTKSVKRKPKQVPTYKKNKMFEPTIVTPNISNSLPLQQTRPDQSSAVSVLLPTNLPITQIISQIPHNSFVGMQENQGEINKVIDDKITQLEVPIEIVVGNLLKDAAVPNLNNYNIVEGIAGKSIVAKNSVENEEMLGVIEVHSSDEGDDCILGV